MNIYQALNRAGKKGLRIEFVPLFGTNGEIGKVYLYHSARMLSCESWHNPESTPQAAALKALRAALA